MSDVDFKDVATAAAVIGGALLVGPAVFGPGAATAGGGAAAGGAAAGGAAAGGGAAGGAVAGGAGAAGAGAAGGAAAGAGGTTAAAAGGVLGTGLSVGQLATTGAVVGGTGMSIAAQQEAARRQQTANLARQRVSEIQNRRARLRTLEEQRIRGAQAQQAGAGAGLGAGTTSVRGTVASLRAQAAGNIGAQQTMAAGERSIFMSEQAAARAAGRADLFGEAARLGGELGGYQPLRDLFG